MTRGWRKGRDVASVLAGLPALWLTLLPVADAAACGLAASCSQGAASVAAWGQAPQATLPLESPGLVAASNALWEGGRPSFVQVLQPVAWPRVSTKVLILRFQPVDPTVWRRLAGLPVSLSSNDS